MAKPSLAAQLGQLALGSLASNVVRKRTGRKSSSKRRAPVTRTRTVSRRKASHTPTVTRRRRRKVTVSAANEHRSVSLAQGAKGLTARQLAMFALEPQWFRVQGLSQFDTTSGFYPCAHRFDSTAGSRLLPVHVWDLTCLPQGGLVAPCGYGLVQTTTGDASIQELSSQDSTGTTVTNSRLIGENLSQQSAVPWRKSLHEYSHIKLNLYGVRNRATRWLVQIVMVKDEFADFQAAGNANMEKKKLYDWLARPFIFSNLNQGDPQTRVDIKVLKSFEVIIDPITTDMVSGAAATPRIQTVNWFIKHNRQRLYDWRRESVPFLDANAGWDQEVTTTNDIRVHPSHRVYLMLRALSPSRRDAAGLSHMTAPDVATEPSYDLVIRHKHMFPI